MSEFLFTSESVSEGHPDKVADQISDAVLDAILEQDPTGRVAAETLVSTGLVVMAGEITTKANVDFARVARDTIRAIGYNDPALRFDADGCAVMVCYGKQSPDIAQGVDRASDDYLNQGAGDQGLMFGYACDETPALMPFPIYYAHRIVQRQSEVRRDGRLPFLRPDAKSQVTVRYVDGKPVGIETVVLSTQHHPSMNEKQDELAEAVIEEIIKPVLPKEMLTARATSSTRPAASRSAARTATPASPAARSSSTPTAARRRTAAARSPARIRPRSTARPPTPRATSRRTSSRPGSRASAGAGRLRDRRREADERHRLHRGHRQDPRREDRRDRAAGIRPAAEGHRADARPAAPDLPQDRRVRPLRPRRARVHVGARRSRRRRCAGPPASDAAGVAHACPSEPSCAAFACCPLVAACSSNPAADFWNRAPIVRNSDASIDGRSETVKRGDTLAVHLDRDAVDRLPAGS